MTLTDTHCHIHDPEFFEGASGEAAYKKAVKNGVSKLLLVGTSLASSKRAIAFAAKFPKHCWASVGLHPHEAARLSIREIDEQLRQLASLVPNAKVVAVGECGFDFYYNDRAEFSDKQRRLFEGQLQIAGNFDLPMIFHVREGFADFWPLFDRFPATSGVLHSFTDRQKNLDKALERDLFIGVNGIATFTSHQWQKELYRTVPLSKLLLETDSPFLTPTPVRGTINLPENVIYITQYMAELRGEAPEKIASATTLNARELFGLKNDRLSSNKITGSKNGS